MRFTRVVERSGKPHVHTLWVAPEKDAELKRALGSHRVMAVEPSGATNKTDLGVVGFNPHEHKGAQILIFPKSLKPFEGARVVGVKFDLVDQPDVVAATGDEDRSVMKKRAGKAKPPKARAATGRAKTSHRPSAPERESNELADELQNDLREPTRQRAESGSSSEKPPHRSPPAKSRRGAKSNGGESDDAKLKTLLRDVRAAMNELQRGKAVAAYQRLQHAVAKAG